MTHVVPSREKVKKAGKVLIKEDATTDEFNDAMAVLSQWRALHSYTINTFQAMLRGKVKQLGFKARFDHEPILPPVDYIEKPKDDGYRSLHQVFKYKSTIAPELNGLFIELQIRTKLQHSWATAVETLGLVEKSSFKTGEGAEEFKRFFKLASVLFAHHESQPYPITL